MLICKFCGKECKNLNSHVQHELRCPKNPNKISSPGMTGKKGGNQFTTGRCTTHSQETINKIAEKSSLRRHTDETKEKLSLIRRKFLEENPDKVPYLINHSSKISYPETYFLECFSNLHNVTFQHRILTYNLDFANVTEKLYLEIDGDQHYLDKRIVEHDKIRTSRLLDIGWVCVKRVRWADYLKLSDEEKQKYVQQIGSMMKWVS